MTYRHTRIHVPLAYYPIIRGSYDVPDKVEIMTMVAENLVAPLNMFEAEGWQLVHIFGDVSSWRIEHTVSVIESSEPATTAVTSVIVIVDALFKAI